MKEWLTVEEVAEVAAKLLGDIKNARDWNDLRCVYSEVAVALVEETDCGQCNPQQVAIYRDVMTLLFLAALSPNAEWPPRQGVTDAQRRQIGELEDLICDRLEQWTPLCDFLRAKNGADAASSPTDGDIEMPF